MTNKMKTVKIDKVKFNVIGAKNKKDLLEFETLIKAITTKKKNK